MALEDRLRRLERRAGPRHRPPGRPSDVPTRRALIELDEEIRRIESLMSADELREADAEHEQFLRSIAGLPWGEQIGALEASIAELEEEGED